MKAAQALFFLGIALFLEDWIHCHPLPSDNLEASANTVHSDRKSTRNEPIHVCGSEIKHRIREICKSIGSSYHSPRDEVIPRRDRKAVTRECCNKSCPWSQLVKYCGNPPLPLPMEEKPRFVLFQEFLKLVAQFFNQKTEYPGRQVLPYTVSARKHPRVGNKKEIKLRNSSEKDDKSRMNIATTYRRGISSDETRRDDGNELNALGSGHPILAVEYIRQSEDSTKGLSEGLDEERWSPFVHQSPVVVTEEGY